VWTVDVGGGVWMSPGGQGGGGCGGRWAAEWGAGRPGGVCLRVREGVSGGIVVDKVGWWVVPGPVACQGELETYGRGVARGVRGVGV